MTGDPSPAVLPRDFDWLDAELSERDAAAFVHVGSESVFKYLTRYDEPVTAAFVYTPDATVLCVPSTVESVPGATGRIRRFDARRQHPGEAAAEVLDELLDSHDETVLTPPTIPHDAALYVSADYALSSTDAVERARRGKTAGERTEITVAQGVATAGMDRAKEVLTAADRSGDRLLWDGDVVTTGRLREAIGEAVATAGGLPCGTTRIGIEGPPEPPQSDVPVTLSSTITVSLSPREPGGYHGHLTRTLVVDGDGGWERRAHVAVTNARSAALATLDAGAGVTTGELHRELVAEIGAYGFDPSPQSGDVIANLGHGVGLDQREPPAVDGTTELSAGTVLVVRPGLADAQQGYVALGDVVVVEEDGVRPLVEYPLSMEPGA
ncbi:M24 family metallopeptidase [Natranaeroarchaeum aerophilus]|uniref:M24 family metallopeptidase n=1 Tax=Natranaeroarchaeum aerophilus TaxID=2917711 RepID=A0AAE3FNW5_9EURY|nr:M24 family metallopeptidase [Natranaeroarchaeum aerophilus]MCL9812431.1 M24 family metallopeptidase [Natranaeroarchaeum aerophilus]